MKERIEAVFNIEEKILLPEPLFGFTLQGTHEKSSIQLRQMISRDRRLSNPLENFESKLEDTLREHCAVTGKDYNLLLKRAMEGYGLLFNEEAGRMNLIIERVESGHPDLAVWDAKWIGPPPMVAAGEIDGKMNIIPVCPARICLIGTPNQYDVDIRDAFETVIGLPIEDVIYANPFYIIARTINVEGSNSVHYPVSILNDVMAVALNLKPLHHSWE